MGPNWDVEPQPLFFRPHQEFTSRFEDVRSWPKANFRQGAIGLIEVEWTFSANVTHVSCRPWLCEKNRHSMIPFMILRG